MLMEFQEKIENGKGPAFCTGGDEASTRRMKAKRNETIDRDSSPITEPMTEGPWFTETITTTNTTLVLYTSAETLTYTVDHEGRDKEVTMIWTRTYTQSIETTITYTSTYNTHPGVHKTRTTLSYNDRLPISATISRTRVAADAYSTLAPSGAIVYKRLIPESYVGASKSPYTHPSQNTASTRTVNEGYIEEAPDYGFRPNSVSRQPRNSQKSNVAPNTSTNPNYKDATSDIRTTSPGSRQTPSPTHSRLAWP